MSKVDLYGSIHICIYLPCAWQIANKWSNETDQPIDTFSTAILDTNNARNQFSIIGNYLLICYYSHPLSDIRNYSCCSINIEEKGFNLSIKHLPRCRVTNHRHALSLYIKVRAEKKKKERKEKKSNNKNKSARHRALAKRSRRGRAPLVTFYCTFPFRQIPGTALLLPIF